MKRRNFNKSILQQGGLMIEALAMLGLIAVVTPTMYKKSAERTMEVEDINTAATIRTITAAANDYVSANYSTILGDMVKNGEHERKLDPKDLGAYLPYGFDIGKSLYNYDGEHIQLSVSRPEGSNNLTTLMLFPAKLNEENGIGQERTSRIAALIGSSGGYVTDSNKARGIGGIWELSGDHYTKNFSSANKYSIVTVSADTISASAGNEMDYSKYLQRGKDPDDTNSQWKNTMRTDLYMGGPEGSSEDVYREATGPWSIRNINSLIVGANTSGGVDGEGNDLADAGGYGLYVAPGAANPNAYIHGSVEAGNGQLNADENNLKYGNAGTDEDGNSLFGFNVDTEGTITNLKNLNLANLWGRWNNIQIGALDDDDDDRWFVIKADANPNSSDEGNLYLLGDVAEFHNRDTNDNNNDLVVLADWNWDNFRTDGNGNAIPEINYNNSPIFPIRMGSNTKVDSLLAAGQIDAQKLRLATLEAGSENIDDENKWLKVDKNGVKIQALSGDLDEGGGGTYASYDSTNIFLRTGDESEGFYSDLSSDHDVQLNLRMEKNSNPSGLQHNIAELYADYTDIRGKDMARISGKGTIIQATSKLPSTWGDESDDITDLRDTVDPNTLLLRNDGMQMQMSRETFQDDTSQSNNDVTNAETVFSPRNSTSANTRTSFRDMHVDLKDSNFKIVSNNKNIFSVRGNNDEEKFFSYINNDLFTRDVKNVTDVKKNIANNYDIALHGNVVIAPPSYNNVPAYSATNYHANVSIGTLNKQAGINILDNTYTYNDATGFTENETWGINDDQHNIIIIDQGVDHNTNNNNDDNIVDPGTVYIRKGYVEVHGEDTANTSGYSYNDAYKGKGVLVASRLVANNPTSGAYGATVPQLVTTTELQSYENKGTSVQRYDTYMVNPAYTSVMHDIKLTTRGGARLSDILPDFINKGIYVVNNTFLEVANDTLNYKQWPTTYNKDGIIITTYDDKKNTSKDTTYAALGKSIDFGKTWASPFMGVVPAPQCPPGYGRVITLTPASFETGISGSLQVDDQGRYYVLPEKVQDDQYALTVRGQRPKYETVAIESVSGSMNVSINNSALNLSNAQANVSELSGISTAKYVLASNELKIKKSDSDKETLVDPITPLTVQQSTWLKSGVQKLTSDGSDTGYVQGWATTMGFLYKNALYMPLLDSKAESNKFSWNIFPVMPYTLEGYATVYCYFDRTNLYMGRGEKKYNTGGGDVDPNYESYIDKLNYMSNPSGSTMPDSANKAADEKYRNRLNDPNMKYDEVW